MLSEGDVGFINNLDSNKGGYWETAKSYCHENKNIPQLN